MTRTVTSHSDKAARVISTQHAALFTMGDRRQQRLRRAFEGLASLRHHDRLWQHQVETLTRLKEHFAHDLEHPNAIAVIPTAGGKTEIFGRVVVAHARAAGPDAKPAMILVPTRNLASQTVTRLTGFGLQAVSRRWPVASGRTVGAVVLTYAAFQEYVHAGLLDPNAIDLLVLDEAHCALSELRRPALERFEGGCPILAFSATPAYDLMKNIYAVLGRENEVIAVTPETLRERGVIAPAINYVLAIAMTGTVPEDGREAVRQLRAAARETILQFRRDHVEAELDLPVRAKHYIGYHATCADAILATTAHNARGDEDGLVANISGFDSAEMQDRTIQALRNGKIVGVNNANLLIEGTDVPTVGAVLNFVPTYSLVREIQRCGRALRLDPRYDVWDPRQTSVIVDVFFEINGRIVGRPRFYFEVVNDPTIARIVRSDAVGFKSAPDIAGIQAIPGSDAKPDTGSKADAELKRDGIAAVKGDRDKPVSTCIPSSPNRTEAGYVISSDVRTVEYLVQTRDRTSGTPAYDRWITRDEITANLGFIEPERADAVFDEIEAEMVGKDFGMVHELGSRRIRAGTYLRRGNPNLVYDPDQADVFAALLDYAPRKLRAIYYTGRQILGIQANDQNCVTQMAALENLCLDHRRNTRAAEHTVTFPGMNGPITFDLMRVGQVKRISFTRPSVKTIQIACGINRVVSHDPAEWISGEDLLALIGAEDRTRMIRFLKGWNYRYTSKADANGLLIVPTAIGNVRMVRVAPSGSHKHPALAIHRDDLEVFMTSRRQTKPADASLWLSRTQVKNRIGTFTEFTFKKIWDKLFIEREMNNLRFKVNNIAGVSPIELWSDDLYKFVSLLKSEYTYKGIIRKKKNASAPQAKRRVRLDRAWRALKKGSHGRKVGLALLESLPNLFQDGSEPTVESVGHTFKVRMEKYKRLGIYIPTVDIEDFNILKERFEAMGLETAPMPEHMRTRRMCVQGSYYSPIKLEEIWSDLIKQYESGREVMFNGYPTQAGYYRYLGRRQVFAVDSETAGRIATAVSKRRREQSSPPLRSFRSRSE